MEDIESKTGNIIGDLNIKEMKARTFHFTKEHLLYGRLRPYLNKVSVPDFEGHCSTEIFPILPSDKLNKYFLFYWFIRENNVKEIEKTCTGARMPRANVDEIMKFLIKIPSLKKQKEIVKKLDELSGRVEEYEAILRTKIADLEELKKSVLQKAFEGKL
jgi:type I restriction enzyme S subunit